MALKGCAGQGTAGQRRAELVHCRDGGLGEGSGALPAGACACTLVQPPVYPQRVPALTALPRCLHPPPPLHHAVWTAMSVTGATAATFIAFILPGLLILRVARRTHRLSPASTALALVCVVLGLVMGAATLFNVLWLKR